MATNAVVNVLCRKWRDRWGLDKLTVMSPPTPPPRGPFHRRCYWALSVTLHNRHGEKHLAVSMHVCQQAFVWTRADSQLRFTLYFLGVIPLEDKSHMINMTPSVPCTQYLRPFNLPLRVSTLGFRNMLAIVSRHIEDGKSCEGETSKLLSHAPFNLFLWLENVPYVVLPTSSERYELMSVPFCTLSKLLTVAGRLLWQTLSKPLHCLPSLLSFRTESPLFLAVKLYGSNPRWRCRRGGGLQPCSHGVLLYHWVYGRNVASTECGFTSMNWVIQWEEISPLYGQL